MPQVKIDASFWEKIKRDYSNWKWSWVREAGQNSLDAGATRIDITVGNGKITWKDDGCGMTIKVLKEKFLALGGSNKNFGTSDSPKVGGFGIAKSLLCFTHKDYSVRSNGYLMRGSYGTYTLETGLDRVNGVELIAHCDIMGMTTYVQQWARWLQTTCLIILNGERLNTFKEESKQASTEEWCSVSHFNSEDPNYQKRLCVRHHGHPMFISNIDDDSTVIVDLSQMVLSSNREHLEYKYQNELDKMIRLLITDPDAVLKEESRSKFYQGYGPIYDPKDNLGTGVLESGSQETIMIALRSPENFSFENLPTLNRANIVISNETNREVPAEYLPETLSDYGGKLLMIWGSLICFCAKHLKITESLNYGFVISPNAVACCGYNYGKSILINPMIVKEKSMVQRYKDFDKKTLCALLASCVHELAHINYSWHGDDWGNLFTEYVEQFFEMLINNDSNLSKLIRR